MSRLRLAAALALSTSLLVACGGDNDSDSDNDTDDNNSSSSTEESDGPEAPDKDPASGEKITAAGFTMNLPEGWESKDKSDVPAYNFLALAIDPDDKDGFSDNVNVLEDPTLNQVDTVEELGQAVEKVLKGTAKDVELEDPESIDGEDAAVATATFTQAGATYETLQYAVKHAGKGYIVTFSFSEDRPDDEQEQVAGSVMASWKWTS